MGDAILNPLGWKGLKLGSPLVIHGAFYIKQIWERSRDDTEMGQWDQLVFDGHKCIVSFYCFD